VTTKKFKTFLKKAVLVSSTKSFLKTELEETDEKKFGGKTDET